MAASVLNKISCQLSVLILRGGADTPPGGKCSNSGERMGGTESRLVGVFTNAVLKYHDTHAHRH